MKWRLFNRSCRTKLVAIILFLVFTILTLTVTIVFHLTWKDRQLDPFVSRLEHSNLIGSRSGDYKYRFGPARVPFVKEDGFNLALNEKYFIYSCDGKGMCGGLADREEGIVAAYLISQMLGRKFGIRFTVPCDLSTYLMPNLVNWTVDNKKLRKLSTKYEYIIDHAAWKLRERMTSVDLNSSYPQDVVYFRVNQEFVQYLMKNKLFASLKWAVNLKVPDIYNIVYRRLFQLKPKLDQQFNEFQRKARTKNKKLICTQIRVWKNPTIPNDFEPKEKLNLNVIWDFLTTYNDSSKYSIFVSSDSEEVRNAGRRLYPDVIVDVGGSIVHIERSSGDSVCAGFGKVILDQLVLSTCDVLVLTYSGIGRIASFIRGSSEGLYCASIGKFERCSPFDPRYIPYAW